MKSRSVTIQMKPTEQFPVVLFVMLYKVVLTFVSVDTFVSIEIKASEQHFTVVLFIIMYKSWF